jgi:hypothetical protein
MVAKIFLVGERSGTFLRQILLNSRFFPIKDVACGNKKGPPKWTLFRQIFAIEAVFPNDLKEEEKQDR